MKNYKAVNDGIRSAFLPKQQDVLRSGVKGFVRLPISLVARPVLFSVDVRKNSLELHFSLLQTR